MNISEGFSVNSPSIFVPWGINSTELTKLFEGHSLRKVTRGYYTIDCEPLTDLHCCLGFHLRPSDSLIELEFFRRDYSDQKKSFDEFQSHFENEFGPPTKSEQGNEGFSFYSWCLEAVEIVHFVYDRFGPEEHMRIKKR